MPPPKIFISYAHEDGDAALRLYRALQQVGCEPWIDHFNLLPGQHWKTAIREAIGRCDFFIACLSSRSVGKIGFFQSELKEAYELLSLHPDGNVFFIPARLDDCEVPSALAERNWANLHHDGGLTRLIEAISGEALRRGLEPCNQSVSEAVAIWSGTEPPAQLGKSTKARRSPRRRAVKLRVHYKGVYFLWDVSIKLLLDGIAVGSGTIKKGFDLLVATKPGDHVLGMEVGGWPKEFHEFPLAFTRSGDYDAHLYLDENGRFAMDLKKPSA